MRRRRRVTLLGERKWLYHHVEPDVREEDEDDSQNVELVAPASTAEPLAKIRIVHSLRQAQRGDLLYVNARGGIRPAWHARLQLAGTVALAVAICGVGTVFAVALGGPLLAVACVPAMGYLTTRVAFAELGRTERDANERLRLGTVPVRCPAHES